MLLESGHHPPCHILHYDGRLTCTGILNWWCIVGRVSASVVTTVGPLFGGYESGMAMAAELP